MGKILKKGSKNSVFIELAKFDYSFHFYFYERKQNKRVHALYRAIVTITEDC